jgi:hypothetical protein
LINEFLNFLYRSNKKAIQALSKIFALVTVSSIDGLVIGSMSFMGFSYWKICKQSQATNTIADFNQGIVTGTIKLAKREARLWVQLAIAQLTVLC